MPTWHMFCFAPNMTYHHTHIPLFCHAVMCLLVFVEALLGQALDLSLRGMSWLTSSPITRLASIMDGIECVSSLFRLFLDLNNTWQNAESTLLFMKQSLVSYRLEYRRSQPKSSICTLDIWTCYAWVGEENNPGRKTILLITQTTLFSRYHKLHSLIKGDRFTVLWRKDLRADGVDIICKWAMFQ